MSGTMNSNDGVKVSSIIVTYNPIVENLALLLTQLCPQVSSVIIVDNGSENSVEIETLKAGYQNLDIIFLSDNVGIAAAQNVGIRSSIELHSQFSLFFDQDSNIPKDFVSQMVSDFLDIKKTSPIAALGPTLRDNRYKKFYPVIRLNKYGMRKKIIPDVGSKLPIEVSCIIASGSLIENALLCNDAFLMDEKLFIDYVDTEWCFRLISHGYGIYVTPNVIMEHEIGDEHIDLLGFVIPVHSPNRRYYRVRNGFYLFKMNHIPKLLAIREVIFSFIHQVVLCIYKKNKDYVRFYLKSFCDAMKK